MTNNMTSTGLWKMLYLPKLYKLMMAPMLGDVWQIGCNADSMTDGKAMLLYAMHGTCWEYDRYCGTWC